MYKAVDRLSVDEHSNDGDCLRKTFRVLCGRRILTPECGRRIITSVTLCGSRPVYFEDEESNNSDYTLWMKNHNDCDFCGSRLVYFTDEF